MHAVTHKPQTNAQGESGRARVQTGKTTKKNNQKTARHVHVLKNDSHDDDGVLSQIQKTDQGKIFDEALMNEGLKVR